MVDQIEFHPGYHQPELVKWCKQRGIAVEAWSALGSGAVLGDPVVGAVAEKHGARWYTAGPRSRAGHPHHPLYLKKDSLLEPFTDLKQYLFRLSEAKHP